MNQITLPSLSDDLKFWFTVFENLFGKKLTEEEKPEALIAADFFGIFYDSLDRFEQKHGLDAISRAIDSNIKIDRLMRQCGPRRARATKKR
jgi:hypothetical protein